MKFFVIFLSFLFAHSAHSVEKPTEFNLEAAQKIVNKAVACGKKNNWKLSIAIVNSEGNLMYFHRGDGTYVGSIDGAIDKAKSANAFQRPTKAFADSIKEGRVGLVTVKDVVANEGGLPIQIKEKYVGAIGISGAKAIEDEQCAKIALE
ncbi:MAG: heme-binding protein [Bdellovibrionota bacterium]